MAWFRRSVFYLMIPMNIFCIVWLWLGRWMFEIGGLMLLVFTVFLGPVMVIGLTLTSILAFRQEIPTERGGLTLAQSVTHLGLWVAMGTYGFFLVDTSGGGPNSDRSIFTLAAGDESLGTSFDLATLCMWVTIALYVLLLVLLIVGQRNRSTTLAGRDRPGRMDAGVGPHGY